MGKWKKFVWVLSIFLMVILLGTMIRQCVIYYILPPDYAFAQRLYEYDQEHYQVIIDYFAASGDQKIHIDKASYQNRDMQVAGKQIEDPQVLKALKHLFLFKGYRSVGRNGDTIYFEKWSFWERSRGLVYLLNEASDVYVEFIVSTKPLSDSPWYYYETDVGQF